MEAGACSFSGCNDPTRANYEPQATFDDGTCSASRRQLSRTSPGDGEVAFPGYATAAAWPSGVHRRLGAGCSDPQASNYDGDASSHDQVGSIVPLSLFCVSAEHLPVSPCLSLYLPLRPSKPSRRPLHMSRPAAPISSSVAPTRPQATTSHPLRPSARRPTASSPSLAVLGPRGR